MDWFLYDGISVMKGLSSVIPNFFGLPSLTLGLKVIFDSVKTPVESILTNCRPREITQNVH